MSSKKKNKTATTSITNQPALKIGSRIRCTDDGVEGRITWANGVSVKIKWDDGEQVTWKRDSMATRPIEILDADNNEQQAAPAATAEPAVPTEQPQAEQETAPVTPEQPQAEPETMPATIEPMATEASIPTTEATATEPAAVPEATTEPTVPSTDAGAAPPTAKQKRQRKAPTEPREKKLSALDAAAKVLAEAGQAMNAQEMIQAMADKGYWTSPGGKTPAATIYAAIISEIKKKGADARFVKSERGKFARRPAA